ncbi:ABC transporter substrate-binding protein [Aureimonas jatrophae]|uniref:Carbohydrate ABC transporter substrate-binding protein, CUT1 family n=1 Tax=Aureimonas jatrophae TaxID=1166073 RepID=A0A1H0HIU1_9HYPH|nr:sugar ABC transporter substrate-binding protein [Aureimonas jatrophae]MBB3950612.1 multiple sugar transport system substrate-binding protein [Aureimonas jatrophae]SDO19108.1 carbohydrate ABC transporter substrate-binding protein, CUT1 family [Aureimonas jatrophae]
MRKSLIRTGLAGVLSALTLGGTALAGEVVWWTPNFNEARARELVAKFQESHPGITVNLQITTTDGLPQRVLTALQSGAAPDIIDVQHGWVTGYAQNDLVLPLDDVLKDRADYVPASLDYVTYDNKLWGMPYRIESLAVLYNRKHFTEAGLDPAKPPQTWEELQTAAQALTRDGRSGFAITGGGEVGNTIFRSMPFMWMNGGGILSQDGTKVLVNSPETVAAVQFYTDFYKNKLSPASTLENDGTANRRLFIAEKVSMYQAGQFDVKSIQTENPNIDIGVMIMPHPAGKDTAAVLGGWSFVVPKDAKNPDEAKVLVGFLSESANQGFLTDTFPARLSAMDLPRFSDPILQVYKQMLPFGRPVPNQRNWVQISQAYFDGIQRILLGDEDAQTAMDEAAEEIEGLL